MKKIICVLFVVTVIIFANNIKKDVVLIPEESIRFRIIANSNKAEDQNIKKEIKNDLQSKIISKLSSETYESAEEKIEASIKEIEHILTNYNIDYNINYGQNYFPEKNYKGVLYPEGNYQSLVITLGEGIGDNWWCVLFPPLCLLEAEDNNIQDVEYQLYVNKILNKFVH